MRRDGENWSEEESIFNERDRRKVLGRVSNGIHIIERRERLFEPLGPEKSPWRHQTLHALFGIISCTKCSAK